MKWSLRSASDSQEMYELSNDDQKMLSLEFHPLTNSARIEHAGEKRVFMIRREGFLKNRIVLRNEYGMRMGQLHFDKTGSLNGTLELDGEVFNYSIITDSSCSIHMSRAASGEAPLVCDLINGMPATLSGNLSPAQHFLLMTMGWYLSLKVNEGAAEAYVS